MNHLKVVDLAMPERIQVDNGSEFVSKVLDLWAYDNRVTLDFSRSGKPTAGTVLKVKFWSKIISISLPYM